VDRIVLYADDDPDDRAWVAEACKDVDSNLKISFVENGRQVLNFLEPLTNSQLPCLIVLDLNMPELDGRQTLQILKTHPAYRQIPVAVVSTSSNTIDREVCQRLGASLFLIKPVMYGEWKTIIRQLEPLSGTSSAPL
jgi:CheY-like chemotaxis protein